MGHVMLECLELTRRPGKGSIPGPFRARTEKNEGGDFPQHGERSSILQGMYVTIRQQRRSEKRELRERASSTLNCGSLTLV